MFSQFGFLIQEFFICYFYCQKMAFVCIPEAYPLVETDDFLKVPHLVWA
jgi:hypothetical protein